MSRLLCRTTYFSCERDAMAQAARMPNVNSRVAIETKLVVDASGMYATTYGVSQVWPVSDRTPLGECGLTGGVVVPEPPGWGQSPKSGICGSTDTRQGGGCDARPFHFRRWDD